MKRTVLIVATFALVACAVAAWSQGGPPPGGRGGGVGMASVAMAVMPPRADMIGGITSTFSLTADQAASLKAILTQSDTDIQTLTRALADKCKTLRAGVCDSVNVATLLAAAQEAESALVNRCIRTWSEIASSGILTSDQLTQLLTQPGCGGPPPGGQSSSSSQSNSASGTRRR